MSFVRGKPVPTALTLDLPPEEATELVEASENHGMKNAFIIVPTTPEERFLIVGKRRGFYYVSREGNRGEKTWPRPDRGGDHSKHDLPVVWLWHPLASLFVGKRRTGWWSEAPWLTALEFSNPASIPDNGDRAAELVRGLSAG